MNKIISTSIAALGISALLAAPAFAATATTTPAANATAKIQCVGKAVAAREASLSTGMTAYTSALNGAYATRGTELAAAYGKTTNAEVKAGVKVAWTNFKTSVQTARKGWRSAQKSAWEQFRAAAKTCKAPGDISDSSNASSEVSGE